MVAPVSAEMAARRTAAAAAVADFRRAVYEKQTTLLELAAWSIRLAREIESLIDGIDMKFQEET